MYPKRWKRTKKVISFMATFAMLSSTMGTAAAAASINTDYEPVMEEETALNVDSQNVMLASEPVSPPAIEVSEPNSQPDAAINTDQLADVPADAGKAGELSYQEVYEKMNALREKYPEGMTWTNFEPYGTKEGAIDKEYRWKGGTILGNVRSGVGCAAFAFILSDAAFGDLKARVIDNGAVKYEHVRPGDILRVNGNSHSVIVLQKTAVGVIVAEGNYNKSVHWGRAISKEEVEKANFIVTRYPTDPDTSSDADIVQKVVHEGTEGNLKWTLTESGILTISGSGNMKNFTDNDRPEWNAHKDSINTVVIESGVTSIGDYAFYEIGSETSQSHIISVSIPGTVETIGDSAFENCGNLLSATIPEGVKTIGVSAFKGCRSLEYIDFPSSITSVGDSAFMDCDEVTRVRFKPGSESVHIGDNLFARCRKLTVVTLPEKADRISSGMFTNCEWITELYIPAGIAKVFDPESIPPMSPFAGCSNLKKIYFAGSESEWQNKNGNVAINRAGLDGKVEVECNYPFPNPFLEDPNDPGDMPGLHTHNWLSADWNHDDNYHWHECSVAGCPVTANNEKDSYAQHSYGDWVVDTNATAYENGNRHRECTICSYRQNESIPATGSSSGGGSSWDWGSSGGGSWGWGGSWGSGTPSKPVTPSKPDNTTEPDATEDTSGNTENTSGNNTAGDTSDNSSDSENTGNVVEDDTSDISASELKLEKAKFKKQLKTDLKKQIKAQVKTNLKKQLKTELKLKGKAKLKKQLKAEVKAQVKAKLKKQLKKQFGKQLGQEFSDLFNVQFNEQFNKVFNDQFNTQYKQLAAKQKKSK